MGQTKRPLQKMFGGVTDRYDFLNRTLTLGLDEGWRARATTRILEGSPGRIMDLCCGTGDLVVRLGREAPGETEVIGLDFSAPMLEVARRKVRHAGLEDRLQLVLGDAAEMPYPTDHLDAIGIAFAFRNLTFRNPRRERYLAEILRVLRPGGRFVIVESSQPSSAAFRAVVHGYLKTMVAGVGGMISGNKTAYGYLARSAANFYEPGELVELLLGAGFAEATYTPLLGGVSAIHVACK